MSKESAQMSVYVPQWLEDEVAALAKDRERSTSYIVRQALAEYLAREKPLKPVKGAKP